MIMSQGEIRNRIDHLNLSYKGYTRQLRRPDLSDDRRERLDVTVSLLKDEIATLETLAQFGRVEPDRDKIETEARSRLNIVRDKLADNETLVDLSPEERELTSGEIRALQWALGEDKLTQYTRDWAQATAPDPARLSRNLPVLLSRAVKERSDPNARANAAYDLGKLHITEAIPALADALGDEAVVAEIALAALATFSDDELRSAGLGNDILLRVSAIRGDRAAPGT